jgi:endonuclease/exonuclease/phosphatase family metal-dependent hydrolase
MAQPHPGDETGLFRRSICPRETVMCGDFNERVDGPAYRMLTETEFSDAWRHLYGDRPHPPTCGVHDHEQWQEGPHCRDYFFLSRDHAGIRAVSLRVDQVADASDHQPLLLEIAAV